MSFHLESSKFGLNVGSKSLTNVRKMTVRNTCAEATGHVPWDFNGQVMQFRLGQTVSNRKYLEPHHRKTISSRTIYTVFSMAIAHHWSNTRWRLGFTKNEHIFVEGALKRYNILYSTYALQQRKQMVWYCSHLKWHFRSEIVVEL